MPTEWVVSSLVAAIGVLFWALIGALKDHIKMLQAQVDSLLPENRNQTAAIKDLTAAVQALGERRPKD